MTFKEITDEFERLLVFKDHDALRVLLAAIVANRFQTDPVWLFIVAPSASGKTDLINALQRIPGTHMLSAMTPNTLMSGMFPSTKPRPDGSLPPDPSLLMRLKPNTVFLLKDFTTVLNMRPDTKNEIMSQLREVYDGFMSKEFGNGHRVEWEGKVGFISGVTYTIEKSLMLSSQYGDRFLYWKLSEIDTQAAMKKVRQVMGSEKHIRAQIAGAVAEYYAERTPADGDLPMPEVPEHIAASIGSICQSVVLLRGVVDREQFGSHDVIGVNQPESPMRMYKQLMSMAKGFAVVRGGTWDDADYPVLAKLAFDAVPSWRMAVVELLRKHLYWLETDEIGLKLDRPTRTVRVILEDMEMFRLVERNPDWEKGESHQWKLRDDVRASLALIDSPIAVSHEPI